MLKNLSVLKKKKGLNIEYLETSATQGINISELFNLIFDLGNDRVTSRNSRMFSIDLTSKEDEIKLLSNKYNCCKVL